MSKKREQDRLTQSTMQFFDAAEHYAMQGDFDTAAYHQGIAIIQELISIRQLLEKIAKK